MSHFVIIFANCLYIEAKIANNILINKFNHALLPPIPGANMQSG